VAEEGGEIVGHLLFSPGRIDGAFGSIKVEGMGPVAVMPGFQRRGIGSMLVRCGLDALRTAGHGLVMVEGAPSYYSRFGFIDATPLGILCEFNPPPGCFMVQELVPRALDGVKGTAYYSAEFHSVG